MSDKTTPQSEQADADPTAGEDPGAHDGAQVTIEPAQLPDGQITTTSDLLRDLNDLVVRVKAQEAEQAAKGPQ